MSDGIGLVLGIDTSTRESVVVVGDGEVRAVSRRTVGHRHGSHLLEQIEEVLGDAGAGLAAVSAVAVGTGPGSFTGLRVGLATAKTLAYCLALPLVGIPSADALRSAAEEAGAPRGVVVVLPAGAHDHYLARADGPPVLVAPGGLAEALAGQPVISVDLDGAPLGELAAQLGRAAVMGLPEALLHLARAGLAAGAAADVAALTPAYVALPRGVSLAAEDLGWSPDLR